MLRHASCAALVALALTSAAPSAHAREARRDVRIAMLGSPWVNTGYIALGVSSLMIGTLALSPPSVNVAPLDGLGHRAENPTVSRVTDFVWALGLGTSLALSATLEYFGSDSRGWQVLRAPLVLTESLLMATGVVAVLKNIVGECRPRAWDDASQRCVGTTVGSLVREDRVSFPSGHTAPMAALAGASLGLWMLPSRPRSEYIPLLILTGSLALTNMVLRVVAGAHTWVDTGVGLALGFGIGLGTAALHTSSTPAATGLSASPIGVSYAGRF